MAGNGKVTGYTHKGTKWEYQQSWYLLALFTIWFYWFPLVYTGLRTLQFRWIVYGLLYGLPALIQMFFNMADLGVAGFFRKWEIKFDEFSVLLPRRMSEKNILEIK